MDIVEHVFMRYVQTRWVRDLARDLDWTKDPWRTKKKTRTTAETKRENKRKKGRNFYQGKAIEWKESKHKNRLKVGLELVQDAQKELIEAIEKTSFSIMISICTTDLLLKRLIFVSTALNISFAFLCSNCLIIYFSCIFIIFWKWIIPVFLS